MGDYEEMDPKDATDINVVKALDIGAVATELTKIANEVPEGMPAVGDAGPWDATKDWSAFHDHILSETKGFRYFRLDEIVRDAAPEAGELAKVEAIEFARNVAGLLRWLANLKQSERSEDKTSGKHFLTETRRCVILPPKTHGERFKLWENPVGRCYELLKECLQRLDPARLQQCVVCSKLYYAKRSDQPACDRVCAHRLRSQRWYLKRGKEQRSKETTSRRSKNHGHEAQKE